jgi:hypothetical protein
MQNKVHRIIGKFPSCTGVLKYPYIYNYIIKLCRQQAEAIQNHENIKVRYIRKDEAQHRKYKRLQLGGGQMTVQVTRQPF